MNKNFELHYLSDEFYKDFDKNKYSEIEVKNERPYIVLLIKIDNNNYAIPFRTNIKHKYCYKFKNTNRISQSSTGIDFTKAVIVNNEKYIGNSATIDNKEYIELNEKFYFIVNKFKTYIKGYSSYRKGELNEYEMKKYKYCTLKYFDDYFD